MATTLNEDPLYQFYEHANLELARSIILKNTIVAKAMNDYERNFRSVNDEDPSSWRYYCHLAGEYHVADTPMEVVSLDTLEVIPFTKENMNIHRATWRGYHLNSPYYNALVAKFPDQETLIRGIINPIDKQTAIEAEEYQILYYDRNLVNGNEYFLIPELQEQLTLTLRRWDVPAFNITEDLYEAARIAITYMFIPSMIMNIRLKYARTIYANTYHIWNYLSSHLELDRFRTFLTNEQTMWLYKNLGYLIANAGKQDTFEELIEYIMSKRMLPLSNFRLNKNLENVLEGNTALRIKRNQINLPEIDYETNQDNLSLRDLMEKEKNIAQDNPTVFEELLKEGEEDWRFGKHDNLDTKVLESNVVDYSGQEIFPKDETLLDYWIYMAFNNRYQAVISVTNPATAEAITLNPKDAFYLFFYSIWRANSLEDETGHIGYIMARDIYFPIMPNFDLIKRDLDSQYDYETVFSYIREIYPSMPTVLSTEGFNRFVSEIHEFKYKMFNVWGFIEDYYAQGEVHSLTDHLKADHWIDMKPHLESYYTYFKNNGWQVFKLDKNQYLQLADDIFKRITGSDLEQQNTVEQIQSSMVRLMEKMTSYHIHFTKSINAQDVVVLNPKVPRFGLFRQKDKLKFDFHQQMPRIIGVKQKDVEIEPFNPTLFNSDNTVRIHFDKQHVDLGLPVDIKVGDHEIIRRHVPFTPPKFTDMRFIGYDEDDKRKWWIHNGSLMTEYVDNDSVLLEDTISLEIFTDDQWIDISKGMWWKGSTTPFDWKDFRTRYGSTTKAYPEPHFDGSLFPDGFIDDSNAIDINTAETKLNGFVLMSKRDIIDNNVLKPIYQLNGFEPTTKLWKQLGKEPNLTTLPDKTLDGFVLNVTVAPIHTRISFQHLIDPNIGSFELPQP